MKTSNMKIATKIYLGLSFILMLVIFLGALAYFQSNSLWNYTNELYNHPLQIARSIRDLNADVLEMRQCINNMVLINTQENFDDQNSLFSQAENDYKISIGVLRAKYLGNEADIDSIEIAFNEWKIIADETKRLVLMGESDLSYKKIIKNGDGIKQIERVLFEIKKIKGSSKIDSDNFFTSAKKIKNTLIARLGLALLLIFFLALAVGILLIKSILTPIKDLTVVADKYERGEFSARSIYNSTSELGQLASTFNKMASSVESEMKSKENVADISQTLMEENELQQFSKKLLTNLLLKTDAQVGVVYLLD